MTRAMRPFFGYYGGKWRDAVKNYPAPEHAVIVEPFAGSAGYALRYPDRKVVLCERIRYSLPCGGTCFAFRHRRSWRYQTSPKMAL